ncbi:MAG: DUF2249 domain-containing protein [Pyrinomonadaceae bacterium]
MKIKGSSKIKDVLAINEEKMITTLMWLAPEFERLQYPKLRRAMAGRVSVSQAARIARIPLTEILYVLNLAAGEDEAELSEELSLSNVDDFQYTDNNLPIKPAEIATAKETDENVVFVDLMKQADEKRDPMPAIAKGLVSLNGPYEILLLRHPFNPIPLRDMFARKGFASWAEERKMGDWFIYFYRPALRVAASAHPAITQNVYARAFAAAA